MVNDVNMTVDFAGVKLANCVLTASGTCGYAAELADFLDISALGGFITKSITLHPRAGNPTPRAVETNAGMLNAIGLANIGVENFIEERIPVLRNLGTAVFVNVAGKAIDEYVAIVQRLSGEDAIKGFELNISCPNVKKGGITFGIDPVQIREITGAVKQAAGSKCLIVKLTPSVTDIAVTAQAAVEGGADALSLVNTFTAMVVDIYRRRPVLANRTGGLSGPAIKPIAVYMVNRVYEHVARSAGVPVLGLGGIRTASDALEFIIAGASAVAVGTATFANPGCAVEVLHGIRLYCRQQGITDVNELVGCLQ